MCAARGLILGLKARVPNTDIVKAGYAAGVLTVPAADNVIRLLPALKHPRSGHSRGAAAAGGGGRVAGQECRLTTASRA